MQLQHLLALALSLATSEAASKGFNYGNKNPDGSSKSQSDFQSEFTTAQNLVGTEGFNSARLYTMIQGDTTSDPISAIPAAIASNTTLLLGLWASGNTMANEITALKAAIEQYGDAFTKLVVGISVGSEDLYRNSVIGTQANAGLGVDPHVLVDYIDEVRSTIASTSLSGCPIGHVDTWNDWTNSSNSAVIDAVDWVGFDGYPYFQNTMDNSIDDGKRLFEEAVAATKGAAGGKEVWITETGWPVSGKTENLAVASVENAKRFWDEVGCPIFDKVNTWWYTLYDASGDAIPNPSFGILGNKLSTTPLFDLACNASSSPSSTASAASSTSAAGSAGATGGSSSSGSAAGGSSGSSGSSGSDSSSSGSTGSGSSGSDSSSSGSTGSDSSSSGSTGSGSTGSGSTGSGSTGSDSAGSNSSGSSGSGASGAGSHPSYNPYNSYGSYNGTGSHFSNSSTSARPSASVAGPSFTPSTKTGSSAFASSTMFTGAATSLSASAFSVALGALVAMIVA